MFITTRRSTATALLPGIIAFFCTPAFGDFIYYGQADRDAWFEDLPDARAITFQEHPFEYPTVLLDTAFYEESHGVVFSMSGPGGPLQLTQDLNWQLDGHGLTMNQSSSTPPSLFLNFTEPMIAFAGAFNGSNIGYEVYSKGLLIESGSWSFFGWQNNFRGFVSDAPFDQVRLTGHGGLAVDDFYFAAIPAPASLAMLVLIGARGGRRRPL